MKHQNTFIWNCENESGIADLVLGLFRCIMAAMIYPTSQGWWSAVWSSMITVSFSQAHRKLQGQNVTILSSLVWAKSHWSD